MTDDDESYCKHLTDPENGYRCILGLQTSSEKCAGDFSIRCDQRAIISVENRVPSSTELITMANLEWRNREERRGIHNREDWCCGWMAGFLTEKKPNWAKEQIEAAKSSARKEMAKTLSEILDREWMCDLNEIKYIMDCVANGNTDPFKDRPEKGVEKGSSSVEEITDVIYRQIRPEIRKLAMLQEQKFALHDLDRGNPFHCDDQIFIARRLRGETREMRKAMQNNERPPIIWKEAADRCNFILMQAVAYGYQWKLDHQTKIPKKGNDQK